VQNEVLLNSLYIDPGATAMDDRDGDISDSIEVDATEVDTSRVGTYRVTYRLRDSGGCEVTAERLVRVFALVPTSDYDQLTSLCVLNIPRVEELCARVENDGYAPNPASLPSCCVALSDLDDAGCFCVPEFVDKFQGTQPSLGELAAFTPLACGFRIKIGDVCEDQQLLTQFLSTPTAVPEVTIPNEKWTRIVDDGGVLREDVSCSDTVTVTQKYCGAIQQNVGVAPRISDFAPCCATAARLHNESCLCDDFSLINDDNVDFLRELVGFTPLGCGFNLTKDCPELAEKLGVQTVSVDRPSPPPTAETSPLIPVGPEGSITRPLEGFGVVVENGEIVPSDEPGATACDAVRELQNFLVVGSRENTTEYDVLGAIGCCSTRTIQVPELTVVIGYRPRYDDVNTFVPAKSVPEVTCQGLTMLSARGDVLDDDLCDNVAVKASLDSIEITLRNLTVPANAAIAGRRRDGKMFTVTHETRETLDALVPVVLALQCDTSGSWADALEPFTGGTGRKLLQFFGGIPFFPDFDREDRPRDDVRPPPSPPLAGFNLSQYARPSFRDEDSRDEPETPPQQCRDVLPRVRAPLKWYGERLDGDGDYRVSPFARYDFRGSIGVDENGDSVRLTDVNVPIVLSSWVNDANGTWREIDDPLEEYSIECSMLRIRDDASRAPSVVACGGLEFYMTTYTPRGVFREENDQPLPKVVLLEVSLSNVELCGGCRLEGDANGTLFSVVSRSGARFDYVGPSVGNPTCRRDLEGMPVEVIAPLPTESPMAPPSTSGPVCNGEKGLNLKGILIRDGSKFVVDTEEECCLACWKTPDCDTWVYCTGDCKDFAYHSCWLKRSISGGYTVERGPTEVSAWDRGEDVPWTSGWFPSQRTPPSPPASPPVPPSPLPTPSPSPSPTPTPSPSPSPTPAPPAPDSATYFTLQPGVPVQIPASTITVTPGARIPSEITPPAPGPTPTPPTDGLSGLCSPEDSTICPTETAPERLRESDVRFSLQLLPGEAGAQAVVTGTAINFGRVSDNVCLRDVTVTLPFERRVKDPNSSEFRLASPDEFVVDCVFVGVRSRGGPPSQNANGCDVYATARVIETGVELEFQDFALCAECWLVGGPSSALFTVRHVDDLELELPEATVAQANVITEAAAVCAP